MQTIFVNRVKCAILPPLQPTKKHSACIEQRVTLCIAPTIAWPLLRVDLQRQHSRQMANEPFAMRQLMVANRRYGSNPVLPTMA
jgi:hypothetical protein